MASNDDVNRKNSLHKNTQNKGSTCTVRVGARRFPLHPLVTACLGLLNTVLVLAAVVVGIYCGKVSKEYTPPEIKAQELIMEVKHLQIMHNEAVIAQKELLQTLEKQLSSHQEHKLQLEQSKTLSDRLQREIETLLMEKATLHSDSLDIKDSCGRCLHEWFLLNTSCYFHGKSAQKSWSNSRADCISRGADLAVIDTWEEQVNLFEYLPKQNPTFQPWLSRTGGIWIGLTDIQTEGTWVWVNSMTQREDGYWIENEPNNYGSMGEDCVAMTQNYNPRQSWFDVNCQSFRHWLCESQPIEL